MEKTHIEITKETRRELRVWKAERDLTYDEAIQELIDGYGGEDNE